MSETELYRKSRMFSVSMIAECLPLLKHSRAHHTGCPVGDLRDKNLRPGLESRFEGERRVNRLDILLLHVDAGPDNVRLSNTAVGEFTRFSSLSFVVGRIFFHISFKLYNHLSCGVVLKLIRKREFFVFNIVYALLMNINNALQCSECLECPVPHKQRCTISGSS